MGTELPGDGVSEGDYRALVVSPRTQPTPKDRVGRIIVMLLGFCRPVR